MKEIYIYSLSDENNNIRYIGKTTNIKRRLYSHIAESKRNNNRYVLRWIKSLLNRNVEPIINIIEICNEENWENREIYWIKHYRNIIHNLCNNCNGGSGGLTKENLSFEQIKKKKEIMSNTFSKFTKNDKIDIWKMILNNKNHLEIKEKYVNYNRSIDFGVRNGRQWKDITNLSFINNNLKRKGYTCRKGLFMVRVKTGNKVKVVFSSRNEEEVIRYINQTPLDMDK